MTGPTSRATPAGSIHDGHDGGPRHDDLPELFPPGSRSPPEETETLPDLSGGNDAGGDGDKRQFSLFGEDLFGNKVAQAKSGPLSKRFEFPPFTVLDAKGGDWQERKRAWLSLGIQSEVGRDAEAFNTDEWFAKKGLSGAEKGNTSIFDPTLCEISYRWFCPPGGTVLDPFAGGSVRGIVAVLAGFRYWGCDLSQEQVAANELQRDRIIGPTLPGIEPECLWVCGDAAEVLWGAPEADFVFTCPPYGDLERYSDDPRDLSVMDYRGFVAALTRIVSLCYDRLKANRFAAIVVGDFRDKRTGHYRGFVADTVKAFQAVGMPLYNDAVLLTSIGTLPVRVGKQFDTSRKLGKTHQNVLVFVKGDARKATEAICQ